MRLGRFSALCACVMVAGLQLCSCDEGQVAERTLSVGDDVRTLTLYGNFEIEHRSDSVQSLVVEGSEEEVAGLRVRHVGDSLYLEGLSARSYLRWRDRPLRVRIGFVPKGYLRIMGGGRYRFRTGKAFQRLELRPEHYVGEIDADLEGMLFLLRAEDAYGEMRFRGHVVGTLLKTDGGHTLQAKDLHARWLRVQAGSRSGIYVRAIEQLAVSYWLTGATVCYYGNPKRIVVDRKGNRGHILRVGS